MIMQIRFARNLFFYLVIIFLIGCSSGSTSKVAAVFKSKEQEFVELNKLLRGLPSVEQIDSNGIVEYGINSKDKIDKIDKQHIDIVVSKINAVGASKVKVFRGLFREKGIYIEYEMERKGWLNQKVIYIVFSDSNEDIRKLSEVDGCSEYNLLRDFWYVRVLYDDGVCNRGGGDEQEKR